MIYVIYHISFINIILIPKIIIYRHFKNKLNRYLGYIKLVYTHSPHTLKLHQKAPMFD